MRKLNPNVLLDDLLQAEDQDNKIFREGTIRYKGQSLKKRLQLDQLIAEQRLQKMLKQDAYDFDDL